MPLIRDHRRLKPIALPQTPRLPKNKISHYLSEYTLTATGLRCGGLLGLRLDLHLEDSWLKIMGKGQKERIVPFGNRCARLLQRYVNHFRPKSNSTDIVFLSIMGELMTEASIDSLFRRIAAKANVPGFTYTYAGILLPPIISSEVVTV